MNKIKLKIFAITLVAIIMTFVTQGSYAYYTTTATATNVITMNGLELKIHETTDQGTPFPTSGVYIIPGDVVSKQVSVENTCDEPFYLRVKVVGGIDSQPLTPVDCFALNIDSTNWKLVDGWYYYKEALAPHTITPEIFTHVEIVGSKVGNEFLDKTLTLTVVAQAVQEKNNPITNNDTSTAQGWPIG